MTQNPIPKYRPSLTAENVETILTLAKSCSTLTSEVLSVIAVLAPFKAKIDNAAIMPSHSSARKETLEESLGFSVPSSKELSAEQKRAAAFAKFSKNQSSCTLEEIELAHTYRYENNLMTREEEIIFEGNAMKFRDRGLSDVDTDTDTE